MFADRAEVEIHVTPIMIRGFGHRRYGVLKPYIVEHILLTFLNCFFKKKKKIYVVKSNYFKITPLPHISLFHIPNIMHKYTEREEIHR